MSCINSVIIIRRTVNKSMPKPLNFLIIPSCQTPTMALEMSKDIILTLKEVFQSRFIDT